MEKLQRLQMLLELKTGQYGQYSNSRFDQISRIGSEFPDEYQEFMRSYGPGRFGDTDTAIYSPFIEPRRGGETAQASRLSLFIRESLDSANELAWKTNRPGGWESRSNGNREKQFQFKHKRLDLIPWGLFGDGVLCWLPLGDRNSWPIILTYESGGFEIFELKFLDFIIALVEKTLEFNFYPSSDIFEGIDFSTYFQR
jgi:hypothetical protein